MAVKRSRSSSRKTSKKMCPSCGTKKRSVKKSSKKLSGGGKKLNSYFKKMLAAKKANKPSFNYKGKKYVGTKHELLGMVYKSV